MNLFDTLVNEALEKQPHLAPLKLVVEKELLHHDILRILSEHDFLSELTFIGGTCLRLCYGGIRLSEDLDFTGGSNFSRATLSEMANIIINDLQKRYGLSVEISEPVKDKKNVDTWKIKIETRPEKKHFPAQRINIDICAIPSYQKVSMMLINPYGVEMGTSGLIIQAESCQEIYTDKFLAIALRPNRVKYRDLWDLLWFEQKNIKPDLSLIPLKLNDRHLSAQHFLTEFKNRASLLKENEAAPLEFKQEMERFLSPEQVQKTIDQKKIWDFLCTLLTNLHTQIQNHLNS